MLTTDNNNIKKIETSEDELAGFFSQAVERHQAEDWQAAEIFYQKVLAVLPEQANANFNLGMLKIQMNQANESLNYFKSALDTTQEDPKYWLSYIEALMQAGQKKNAVDTLLQGLELGLRGEEVNALVEQLTKPVSPSQVIPITVANYANLPAAITVAATVEKTGKEDSTSAPVKLIHQYSDNPQIKKILTLHQSGKLNQAKKQGTKLLKLYPKQPILLTCLGMVALEQDNIDEGITWLQKSLEIEPGQTTALSYLSIAYIQRQHFDKALSCANSAIELNANYAQAHANKANVLSAMARYDEAIASYKKAISLNSDDFIVQVNLGEVYIKLKQYQEAEKHLEQAVLLNTDDVRAQQVYAGVLYELEQYDRALECLNTAALLDPKNVNVKFDRGFVNLARNAFKSACADFEFVIQEKPTETRALINLGVALRERGRLDEALAINTEIIRLDKTYIDAYMNQGLLLTDMQRFDEALDYYNQALANNPRHADTLWNKSLMCLLLGDFKQGWSLYEHRWKSALKGSSRHFSKPLWLGDSPISGKTLLIYPEQGFGDYIQFCRFAADIEALGAQVVLEVPKPLMSLVSTLKGHFTFIEAGSSLPVFDYHCPLMSLPLALNIQLENIPTNIPYLYASEQKKHGWQKKLGSSNKPSVGLVCSGSPTHKKDHHRSVALKQLKPLLSLPIDFHILQKEIKDDDMDTLAALNTINTHQDALQDFSDTAALIEQMDIVITVDTSVAHLAGAMGKDCWVLLPYVPDFRWMLNRTDNLWYPSITLFRQPEFGDWSSVVDAVCLQLQDKLNQK